MAPVIKKVARHPHASAMKGTVNGAMIAPIFVPELKIPVARALSLLGNHSASSFDSSGKISCFGYA